MYFLLNQGGFSSHLGFPEFQVLSMSGDSRGKLRAFIRPILKQRYRSKHTVANLTVDGRNPAPPGRVLKPGK